jgi:adenine deaminase
VSDRVDLLVRGTLVNVLTGDLEERAIAVDNGEIVGFGDRPADQTIEGEYITPGLINGHMHVESGMVTLPWYGRAAIPHGVTCIVADPHEIGNVLGAAGIRALLADADRTPFRVRFTVPSSVPASTLQDAGAAITPETVTSLLDEEKVVGLAEVMDVTGVVEGEPAIHAKIRAARERGLTVDGHLPRVRGADLQEAARFIDTDHESIGYAEALEKVRTGLTVFIREGSSSKNLAALKPLVEAVDTRRLALCTDNLYPDDLAEHGGIGRVVSTLIRDGHDPVEVVQMATLNPAEQYDLSIGRVAPGAPADLVLLDDLNDWKVANVVLDGVVDPVAGEGVDAGTTEELAGDSVHFDRVTAADMAHEASKGQRDGRALVRVIDHTYGTASGARATVPVRDGLLCGDLTADVLPTAVVERHGKGAGIGHGFVRGLGLERGAVASTIAHDAHNLIVVGADHDSMARAANYLNEVGGGLAVYDPDDNEVTALSLPIAGLMASRPVSAVADDLDAVDRAARDLGVTHEDGIMLIDNLALEVIPEYRLTNRGLVDVDAMEHVPLVVE